MLALHEAHVVAEALDVAGGELVPFVRVFMAVAGALSFGLALVVPSLALLSFLLADAWSRVWSAARRPVPLGHPAAVAGPLALLGAFGWTVATAHAARFLLARGDPIAVGVRLGVTSLLLLFAVASLALAALSVAAVLGSRDAPKVRPATTTAVAITVVVGLFALGILTGETSGGRGVLGIFGVLRRSELDLRPVVHVLLLVAGTAALGASLRRARDSKTMTKPPRRRAVALVMALPVVVVAALFATSAAWLAPSPDLAAVIKQRAPLGGLSLSALHKIFDRDRDGYSSLFGGGDCDDGDASIHPAAVDVPGNGIDEDCSGHDTPFVAPEEPPVVPPGTTLRLEHPYNVVLITIDTLRFDLGFMGHPRPISPRLDALAARSTVFEYAYAMASMTWQSVGSLLIGKYPSEIGGYERFNHFAPQSVLVTERLREAGVRTLAGMCQFAFSKPNPNDVPRDLYAHIGHGFEIWDTSADPDPNGYDYEDDAVTSDKLTDVAKRLLSDPENVESGRFFAWFHYFDPHTQYVLHPEAPDFSTGDTSEVGRDRARYESEIWFVDRHVGRLVDFIAQQPWASRTAIIVTSDHGEAFNEHGMRWHRDELWNELIRVPLIVYVPGQRPSRVTARRSHIDLPRTILELMGVPAPEDGSLRGESLVADVFAPDGHVPEERPVYAEIVPSEGSLRRALISGPGHGMKIVHKGGASYELYDLDADPGEKVNLARDRARLDPQVAVLQRFRAGLKEIPWVPPKK